MEDREDVAGVSWGQRAAAAASVLFGLWLIYMGADNLTGGALSRRIAGRAEIGETDE